MSSDDLPWEWADDDLHYDPPAHAGVAFDAIERETEKALLFVYRGEQCWIPKSQVIQLDRARCRVVVSEWADEKLIEKGFPR